MGALIIKGEMMSKKTASEKISEEEIVIDSDEPELPLKTYRG